MRKGEITILKEQTIERLKSPIMGNDVEIIGKALQRAYDKGYEDCRKLWREEALAKGNEGAND